VQLHFLASELRLMVIWMVGIFLKDGNGQVVIMFPQHTMQKNGSQL
jgi:hypothetical protein